jgi:hypothetical protein
MHRDGRYGCTFLIDKILSTGKDMAEFGKHSIQAVSAILVNARGEVLLQCRDDRPGLSFLDTGRCSAARWKRAIGSDRHAARANRELGRSADVRLWRVYRRPHDEAIEIEQYIFAGEIDWSIEDLTVLEGQGADYFSLEQLGDLPIAYGFREVLEEFLHDQEVTQDSHDPIP